MPPLHICDGLQHKRASLLLDEAPNKQDQLSVPRFSLRAKNATIYTNVEHTELFFWKTSIGSSSPDEFRNANERRCFPP
jgi:hypothetical protein